MSLFVSAYVSITISVALGDIICEVLKKHSRGVLCQAKEELGGQQIR